MFPVCSFCGEEPVVAWFQGPTFLTAVDRSGQVRSEDAWLACISCVRMVEAEDREGLVLRGARRLGSEGEERDLAGTRRLQDEMFWKPRASTR